MAHICSSLFKNPCCYNRITMAPPEPQSTSLWSKTSNVAFPLILIANLAFILYLVIDLRDYDSMKKELVDKSALLQEAATLRIEISTLKSEKDALEAARKELLAIQSKLGEARTIISRADAATQDIADLKVEEAALNNRIADSRKAISGLLEARSKLGDAEKAADLRIARAAAAADELSQTQAKLAKATADLLKAQSNTEDLAKARALLDALNAEISIKKPELAALRDELKLQTKARADGATELTTLSKGKFDLKLLEDARAEQLRLVSERASIKAEFAQLSGMKEASQKELDTISKSLGLAQGQLRLLLNQKAELETELAALRGTIQKK
jgi:hypothetical protein